MLSTMLTCSLWVWPILDMMQSAISVNDLALRDAGNSLFSELCAEEIWQS